MDFCYRHEQSEDLLPNDVQQCHKKHRPEGNRFQQSEIPCRTDGYTETAAGVQYQSEINIDLIFKFSTYNSPISLNLRMMGHYLYT